MLPEVSDDDLLIENIEPTLLEQIERSARAHGRSVEQEAMALIEIGLSLAENDR